VPPFEGNSREFRGFYLVAYYTQGSRWTTLFQTFSPQYVPFSNNTHATDDRQTDTTVYLRLHLIGLRSAKEHNDLVMANPASWPLHQQTTRSRPSTE